MAKCARCGRGLTRIESVLRGYGKVCWGIITSKRYSYVAGIPFVGEDYLKVEAEGLTRKQIEKIRKLGFKKVKVSSTIPFAPIIFLGVIITLLVKGNILILRYILFG